MKRLRKELLTMSPMIDGDQPIDFGDEGDGDDDPKPDDESKKTPAAPPKAKEPPSVVRDEHVPAGDPSMDHMSKGTAGDGIIYLNDIGIIAAGTPRRPLEQSPHQRSSPRLVRMGTRPRSKRRRRLQ